MSAALCKSAMAIDVGGSQATRVWLRLALLADERACAWPRRSTLSNELCIPAPSVKAVYGRLGAQGVVRRWWIIDARGVRLGVLVRLVALVGDPA